MGFLHQSIRSKFLAAMFLVAITPLVTLLIISNRMFSSAITTQINGEFGSLMEKTKDQLGGFVRHHESFLKTVAVNPLVPISFTQFEFELFRDPTFLEDARVNFPDIVHGRLLTLAGKTVVSTLDAGAKANKPGEPPPKNIERTFPGAPDLPTVVRRDETYVSDIYYSQVLKRPVLTMARHVYGTDLNKPIGLMSIDVDAQAVVRFVSETKVSRNSVRLFMLNKAGEVLHFPGADRLFSRDPLVRQGPQFLNLVEGMIGGKEGYGKFTHPDGRQFFLFYGYLERFSWAIGALVPQEDVLEVVHQFQNLTLVMTCLLMIGVGGLGFLITNRLTKRIHRLGNAADIIAKGDYSQPVPKEGQDEIAVLGTNFEEMRQRVQQFTENLKQMVQQVTMRKQHLQSILEATKGMSSAKNQGRRHFGCRRFTPC